jgi:hypothetical protein
MVTRSEEGEYLDVFRPFTVKVQRAGALQSDRREAVVAGGASQPTSNTVTIDGSATESRSCFCLSPKTLI